MTTKHRFDLRVADRVYSGNPFTLYLNGFTNPFIGACVMVSTNPHDASSYHTSPTLVGRVLSVVEEFPTEDVAQRLGMSAGGVRQARSRVLRRLRAELGDTGGSL